MAKKEEYNNDSISSLKGADRVRKRPAVIFGSDGISGCQHSIFEILSNSIDEAREGYGKEINIVRYKDMSVKIWDKGRGAPVEYNEKEGRYNWELIFCELFAGGKFANNSQENYTYSLGLNGLGLCSTQYASEFMDVEVKRDNNVYKLHFEKGENIGGLTKKPLEVGVEKETGTMIYWKPDLDVFTDINIPLSYYTETIKRQAIVNAGLTFVLYDEETDETFKFLYENGIKDYIDELGEDKSLTNPVYLTHETRGKDREDKEEYSLKFQMAFSFNKEIVATEYYHNSSYLEYGGSPDKAVRNGFLYAIDSYIKQGNLYKKDEKKITIVDILDSLIVITNSFSTITSYENQTKKSITNKFIQDCMTDFLKKNLEIYFIENKADADRIAEQVLINKRSRETAEKTRINIKKKLTGTIDIGNRVEKFVNCRSKDTSIREIYIVEGDSALGSCKLGRDSEFQGIMPVRGKILNCLKADYDKIFNNDIIVDLLRVLGCGVEISTKHNKDLNSFDLEQLKWNKVIICTDADVDGFQIRTLILTMLYRLVPTLIKEGKVYIAESPLYEIICGKKTYFAYTEKDKTDILNKITKSAKANNDPKSENAKTPKYTINRSKGLGENEPEMMWETTMNPETRRLIKVMPEDIDRTRETFELLLGENLKGRKQFIEEFGHKYIDMSDIS